MRRRVLTDNVLRIGGLLLVCLALLAGSYRFVSAQDAEIIPVAEAQRLVDVIYIPSAREAMLRGGHSETAERWSGAMAGAPSVQYLLDPSEEPGRELVPRYLLVPVERGGQMIGLIGLDPHSGEFAWRLDHLSSGEELPVPPQQEQLSAMMDWPGDASPDYSPQDAKLVYAEGESFWHILVRRGDASQYLLLPVGEEDPLAFDHSGGAPALDGFEVEADPLPSSPVEYLVSPSEISYDQAPGGAEATAGSVTWMAKAIPYYQQDCKLWCWAASLSMFHQWWSPVSLGKGKAQQSEIVRFVKGRDSCQGGSADEIHSVVRNWSKVDSDYQDFATSYKGSGDPFKVGIPSGRNNDPKTWLAHMQAPVIAFVDTSSNGKANHAILIVGYDDLDSGGVVYVHDPWYSNWWPGHRREPTYELALSYRDFDEKWNTTYEGQFFGTLSGVAAGNKRRGMVAGIPGDGRLAKVAKTGLQLSGAITDAETERVFDLGLGAVHDDTAASRDSFGQPYESGLVVELADPAQGVLSYPLDAGDFSASPVLTTSHVFFKTSSIPENGRHAGASFHVDPRVLGTLQLRTTWWVYDQDDRRHDDITISVRDDRRGDDASFWMPKPSLSLDTYGPEETLFVVRDDDGSGPNASDIDDSGDAVPGPYLFRIALDDPSGVLDDQEYPRIYVRWDSDEIDALHNDGYLNADWDGAGYVATMTVGMDRVGQTLFWRALAFDSDDDREGDSAAAWSQTRKGGVILEPLHVPGIPLNPQASEGSYATKVQITWEAVQGVDYYEVYRSLPEEDDWALLTTETRTRYDDATASTGASYRYSIKACNSAGCSVLSEPVTGYREEAAPSWWLNLAGIGLVFLGFLTSISKWARKNRVPVRSLARRGGDV